MEVKRKRGQASIMAVSLEGKNEWKCFSEIFEIFDQDEEIHFPHNMTIKTLGGRDKSVREVDPMKGLSVIKDNFSVYDDVICIMDREHLYETYKNYNSVEKLCQDHLEKHIDNVQIKETSYDRVLRYECQNVKKEKLTVHVVTLNGKYQCFESRFAALLDMRDEDPRDKLGDYEKDSEAREHLKGLINDRCKRTSVLEEASEYEIRQSFPFVTILMSQFEKNSSNIIYGREIENNMESYLKKRDFDEEMQKIKNIDRNCDKSSTDVM